MFLQNNVGGFRLACWSFWYWMGGIGGRVRLSSSARSGSSSNFSEQIKGTISREEHKTIYCGLRITGMVALSNQRELPAFYSPRQVTFKISHHIFPNLTVLEDDLPRLAKIPAYDKPESQKWIWWNQQPKAIFQGQAIPACGKPEFIWNFKFTFQGLKNTGNSLWLDKAIPDILSLT
jgi:hypothetical protein